MVPLIVLYLVEIQEDHIFIRAKLGVQTLFVDLLAVADVFQAVNVVAKDSKAIRIVAQPQSFAQGFLHQGAFVFSGFYRIGRRSAYPAACVVEFVVKQH